MVKSCNKSKINLRLFEEQPLYGVGEQVDVGQKLKLTLDQSRIFLAAFKFYCFIIAGVFLTAALIETTCACSEYCLKRTQM